MSEAFDLSNPVFAAQAAFRAIMDATARPGTVRMLAAATNSPVPLSPEAGALGLTLFDHDTPVWLDEPLAAAPDIADWLRFHTGAPVTARREEAVFALIGEPERLPPFETFNTGLGDYPDRSTTLIVQVADFEAGDMLTLSGPGIVGRRPFRARPLPSDMRARLVRNHGLFPCGLDMLFVAPGRIAALPRSTRIEGG